MKYHGRTMYMALSTPVNMTWNMNMQGYLMEADIPLEQDLSDITVAGSTGHKWYPGLAKSSGSFKFIVDDATNAAFNATAFANYMAMQQANPENSYVCNFGLNGFTSGSPKIAFNFKVKSVSLPVRVADADTFSVSWEADNGYTISTWT